MGEKEKMDRLMLLVLFFLFLEVENYITLL